MTAGARRAAAPALSVEESLILSLTEILRTRLTAAGHLAMIVPWERRGGCPITGCQEPCREVRAVLDAAATWLEERAATLEQLTLLPAATGG